MSYDISDGCPVCGARPEDWRFVEQDKWTQYDRNECQGCGSIFDVDGIKVYLVEDNQGEE